MTHFLKMASGFLDRLGHCFGKLLLVQMLLESQNNSHTKRSNEESHGSCYLTDENMEGAGARTAPARKESGSVGMEEGTEDWLLSPTFLMFISSLPPPSTNVT